MFVVYYDMAEYIEPLTKHNSAAINRLSIRLMSSGCADKLQFKCEMAGLAENQNSRADVEGRANSFILEAKFDTQVPSGLHYKGFSCVTINATQTVEAAFGRTPSQTE
jgi:hypothetical protein